MTTPLWNTETFWVGVLTALAGVIESVFEKDWSAGSQKIMFGLGMIAGRAAVAKM